MSILQQLQAAGQSVWLDYIRRDIIENGELKTLIDQGVRGMTSNPTIFEKAIAETDLYKGLITEAAAKGGDAKAIYERVAIRDIQDAADLLRPLYDSSKAADGYVSLEVSPHLHDSDRATVAEANHLWAAIDRPNVMIKVPGTDEGIDALGELTRAGVNVNVTLLFSVNSYRRVAETYIQALEARVSTGADISRLASVASFFVSRIDTAADAQLEAHGASPLAGKTAIANAKIAYGVYQELFSGPRWTKLAAQGAQVQRVLWASTGTKNKKYSDVLYIEELIGPDTVNTIPPATLKAFQAHGKVRNSLQENLAGARADLKAVAAAGVSLDDITTRLLHDGLQSFADSFDKLLAAIEARKA